MLYHYLIKDLIFQYKNLISIYQLEVHLNVLIDLNNHLHLIINHMVDVSYDLWFKRKEYDKKRNQLKLYKLTLIKNWFPTIITCDINY